ncbi:hypothetical protein [Bacillus cereus]|uniref:Uncharacterized protein n=1 Tax=Bacillus cereus TaxID=1396 RepID=A0A2A7HPP8_BACCE|nr:hypothetical protein [Bacillus cereus]PEC18941.1 hypothetical protein COM96_27845 [Bacillus cereus]
MPIHVHKLVVCTTYVNQADPTDVITHCYKSNEAIAPTITKGNKTYDFVVGSDFPAANCGECKPKKAHPGSL